MENLNNDLLSEAENIINKHISEEELHFDRPSSKEDNNFGNFFDRFTRQVEELKVAAEFMDEEFPNQGFDCVGIGILGSVYRLQHKLEQMRKLQLKS